MVSLRDVALAVKGVPERNFKNVGWSDGRSLARPKTTFDPRKEPVPYLEQATSLFDKGKNDALLTFVDAELVRVGARDPITEEAMSTNTRELFQSLKRSLEAFAISKLGGRAVTLHEVGALCADLSKASLDSFDTPTGADRLFYGMTAGHDTHYVLLQTKDADRLLRQASELYSALQHGHVPAAGELGRALARATRDANPNITNVFFNLLDRFS